MIGSLEDPLYVAASVNNASAVAVLLEQRADKCIGLQ